MAKFLICIFLITSILFNASFTIKNAVKSANSDQNFKILSSSDNKNDNLMYLEYKYGKEYGNLSIAYELFNLYLDKLTFNAENYINAISVLYKYGFSENQKNKDKIKDKYFKKKFNYYNDKYNQKVNIADSAAMLSGLFLYYSDKENSFKYINEAYKENPQTYSALIGNYYKLQNKNEIALSYYNEAINYNPNDYQSILNIAEILSMNNYTESLKYCIKLIDAKSNYYQALGLAYSNMVKLNYKDNDIIRILSPNLVNDTYDTAYIKLAEDMAKNYKYAAARKLFNKAIDINPKNNDIYLTAAEIFIKSDRKDIAREFLDKINITSLSNIEHSRYLLLISLLKLFNNENNL